MEKADDKLENKVWYRAHLGVELVTLKATILQGASISGV